MNHGKETPSVPKATMAVGAMREIGLKTSFGRTVGGIERENDRDAPAGEFSIGSGAKWVEPLWLVSISKIVVFVKQNFDFI